MNRELEQEIIELKRQLSEFSKYSDTILTRLIQILIRDSSDDIDDYNPTERDMLSSITKDNAKEVKQLCKEYMAKSITLSEYRKRWDTRTNNIVAKENDTVYSLIFDIFKKELKESDDSYREFTKFMDEIYKVANNI